MLESGLTCVLFPTSGKL